MRRRRITAMLVTACCAAAVACSADLPAPPGLDGGADDTEGEGPQLGAVPMRRLTRDAYARTVTELFGDALPGDRPWLSALPPDGFRGGFATNTTAVTDGVVEQYEHVAEAIAQGAATHRAALHPCLAAPVPEGDCARRFVEDFAPRAMRRPVTHDELDELAALMWTTAPDTAEAADLAVRRVLAALLQSPDFLYRIERGEPDADDTDTVRLSGHEIAVRMSYLIWDSMPDAPLMADAAAGRLHDPGWRAAVLTRLLDDPRARAGLGAMHRQWLELQPLDPLVKDRNRHPTFSEALGPELVDEFTDFVDYAIRHRDGTLHTLLTSTQTIASNAVVVWYGPDVASTAPAPAAFGPGAALVGLDPTRRAGVLTLLSVMAAHAKPDRSDPVGRGVLVRDRLLCQPLAAPPPGAAVPPAAPDPGASARERLEVHTQAPACSGCHARIDPIGLVLEPFDGMGVHRTHDEVGNPIDAQGELVETDVDGPIDGPVALAHALAASEQVERCYATQWFRLATGEVEDDDDAEVLDALTQAFVDGGGHIPTLLEQLVTSEAFVHRRRR